MDFDAKIPPNLNDMARNLWSQLDSMAKNNPRGYKELMSKIEEEAKKTLIPVLPTIEPCFSVKLEGTIISGSKVHYINFCKCNAVEENTKDNDGGIPIVVREEDGKRKYRKYGRTFHVYDVSFNENVIKRAENDPFFKRNLIFMAMNCVEQVFNISFKKDFTITEEKYNGTFIHGHTSREGQPMPTLSQEEVNELLKNASTILNQNPDNDNKNDKNKNKKGSEKPIDITPESILKQHKTYQEEMENENSDKINPEIESTMEKLFFSDEKKEDEKSLPKNNKKKDTSSNNKSLIEEMTEIVPESKTSEGRNEEAQTKNQKDKDQNKNNKSNYIELEGNGIPKIIDLLDDNSSKNKKQNDNDKNEGISEAESKIFDFLKEFDNNSTGKITELDNNNNELPPSKIEELVEEEETPNKIEDLNSSDNKLPASKIEKLDGSDNKLPESKIEEIIEEKKELKINKNEKNDIDNKESVKKEIKIQVENKIEDITQHETIPIVEEPPHKNDTIPVIEEPPHNNSNMPEKEKTENSTDRTPFIEEVEYGKNTTIDTEIESNNDTPRVEDITHDHDTLSKLTNKHEEHTIKPKIEEPPHLNENKPIIEEPSNNNEEASMNVEPTDNTPIIEEITNKTQVFTESQNEDDGTTPKIEDISENKNDSQKMENMKENNEKEEKKDMNLEKDLIKELDKLSIDLKEEGKDGNEFKSIHIPQKEKPKYSLKTSEHYLYIKVKLPKLKLVKTLQWNMSNCKPEEGRPDTEKWLSVNSPEYDLKIRIDTSLLNSDNIRVTFAKSTQTLTLRFDRILNI